MRYGELPKRIDKRMAFLSLGSIFFGVPQTNGVIMNPLDITTLAAPPRFAREVKGSMLLLLGALFVALSANRWSVPQLAWITPVPYLIYVRRIERPREWGFVFASLCVGMLLQVGKIVTPPVSVWMVPAFALPFAFGSLVVLFAWRKLLNHAGDVFALYAFASLSALSEWLSFSHSELGAWGSGANSQLGDLALMQLASLFGVAGIGFLMACCAAALELSLSSPTPRKHVMHFCAVGLAFTLAYAYGAVRLSTPLTGANHVLAAAVVTELGPNEHGFPERQALQRDQDLLFARSKLAVDRGARLVVWNEVASLVEPADEAALLARGRAFAREHQVDLVLAYGTLLSSQPPLIDNQYLWIAQDGSSVERYRKHHPVPGEPSMRGDAPLSAFDRPYARVAGAICYDYDFPALARTHAALGAELVALPASDWKGIDPDHTLMARVRAIEGGFSLLRSVRWATSAAFDPYGRTLASMSAWENNGHVMLASIPVLRVRTLYSRVGDLPVLLSSLAILVLALFAPWRARRRATTSRMDRTSTPLGG